MYKSKKICLIGHRAICLVASVWTLVISAVYLILSSLGLLGALCVLGLHKGGNLDQAFSLTYLNNDGCKGSFNIPPTNNVTIVETFNSPAVDRTFYFMIVYIVISGIWLLASILLLMNLMKNYRGGCGFWLIATISNIIADLIGIIFYAPDIRKTDTFRKLLDFLKADIVAKLAEGSPKNPELEHSAVESYLNFDLRYSWLPSVIMTIFFCRGITAFLINLVLFIAVLLDKIRYERRKYKTFKPRISRRESDIDDERKKSDDSGITKSPDNDTGTRVNIKEKEIMFTKTSYI